MNNDINIVIGFLTEDLWPDVKRIYESGIKTKNATFETSAPEWDSWNRAHRGDCRLAASVNDRVVGWAALSGVSGRCVYSGVAEVSIYVDPGFTGKGVGSILMEELIRESETKGIWTLQAGIFPENIASLKLHGKHGFRTVGIRERLGKLDNKWRDVVLMERRSSIAGID
ncbi:MAG TPA: N-acetyltransferase family protein [Bacteroidales bacterium]|nr:N-acetyltransferase family protein [Bacteroidales bacterium]HPT11369.1 N-acetyltransferase family protein [Bacteroidales bacterium]